MKLIQLILLTALLATLVSYFRWFRKPALDKVLVVGVGLAGMVFVIFPDSTTRIAGWLGVGRGADLLFYIAIVALTYLVLLLYSKIKKLESRVTELVRRQALLEAGRENTSGEVRP